MVLPHPTRPLSNTETETPSEANVSAMSAPVMPPPTMATSQLRCPSRVGYLRVGRWSSCSAHQTGWPRRRAAAFLIVAAQIVAGSRVDVRRVGLNPTRTGLLEILRDMGGSIEVDSAEGAADRCR